MIKDLKKKLFLKKRDVLFTKAVMDGTIKPISEDIYERLSHFYFVSMPIDMDIKFFAPKDAPGKCDERSILLSFGFDDCKVVYGHLKSMEYNCKNNSDFHFWVEANGKCYDPSTICEYDKDLYYEINGVHDTKVYSKEEILETNLAKYVMGTTFDQFLAGGARRLYLYMFVPFWLSSPMYEENQEYHDKVDAFLESINFSLESDETEKITDDIKSQIL